MEAEEAGAPFVTDEVEFLRGLLPVAGARVVELGCGKGAFARTLLQRGVAAFVAALEVDTLQHQANLAAPPLAGLRFELAGAQAIPLPDASSDLAIMLKSLHHVPMPALDSALREVARVLVPGGWLYVSEPVYAGEFNELVRLFHDEGEVRAAAYAALKRAAASGVLHWERELVFDTPLHFPDFDDFAKRLMHVTHSDIELDESLLNEVRTRFQRHAGPDGARFVRQMRVNILRR